MPDPAPDAALAGSTDLARRVTAYGLPGAPPLPSRPLDDRAWTVLAERVKQERIIGPLAHSVGDGALPVAPDQRQHVRDEHAAAMSVALLLERKLIQLAGLLDSRGIPYRVLKGPAVAHTAYPDPSWRSFGDVDLLVPGEQFDRTVALLVTTGHRRPFPELRPGFDRRFGKGATLVGTDGLEVDLHRAFVPGRYGLRMRPDDLFSTGCTIWLAGVPLVGLGPEERFLNACYHAALGSAVPRLSVLRDVAQMLLDDQLDVARVRRLANSWWAEPVVARAVAVTFDGLGVAGPEPLAGWAAAYHTSRADRRAVRSYTTHRSFRRQAIAGFSSVRGLRPKLAFLAAVSVPRRAAPAQPAGLAGSARHADD